MKSNRFWEVLMVSAVATGVLLYVSEPQPRRPFPKPFEPFLDTVSDRWILDVPADGSCFFHAVKEGLRRLYNIDITTLRSLAVSKIKNLLENDAEFRNKALIIMADALNRRANVNVPRLVKDYLARMSNETTWADYPAVHATAVILKENVNVCLQIEQPDTMLIYDGSDSTSCRPLRLRFLGNHYQLVLL